MEHNQTDIIQKQTIDKRRKRDKNRLTDIRRTKKTQVHKIHKIISQTNK